MAAYYLMAAESALRRAKRRLPGVMAWVAFVALMAAPFACAYFAGRASCP